MGCGTPSASSAVELPLAVVSGALQGLSIEDLAIALMAADVRLVELTAGPGGHLTRLDRASVASTRDRLADSGVMISGVAATVGLRLHDVQLRDVLEAADQLEAPFVRVFPPPFDPATRLAEQFDEAARHLRALVSDPSIHARVVLEPSPGTLAPSPELAIRLSDLAGESIGVVYDPGSLLLEGHLTPALAISVLDTRLRHVHVKNRAVTSQDGERASKSRPLDQGWVDWRTVLRLLIQSGYRGCLSIDHLSAVPTIDQLRADMECLKGLLQEVTGDLASPGDSRLDRSFPHSTQVDNPATTTESTR